MDVAGVGAAAVGGGAEGAVVEEAVAAEEGEAVAMACGASVV